MVSRQVTIVSRQGVRNPENHGQRPARADCAGYINWISDGYCDGSNNNEGRAIDGGDCCPGDCVDATYDCASYGGSCPDCLDPNSADNATGGQCEDYVIQ